MYTDSVTAVPSAVLQNPLCPTPSELRDQMVLLNVIHRDFGGCIKNGTIIVHELVVSDVRSFFRLAFELDFPIHSIKTVNEFGWNDELSCEHNNSSGHNMRYIEGTTRLSKHGIGCAFDINPLQNPCIVLDEKTHTKEIKRIPQKGIYDPKEPGTLYKNHPLVELMIILGWAWGGNWTFPLDYQHFQIVPERLGSYVT